MAHRASIISLNGELEVAKYKNSVRYMTHRYVRVSSHSTQKKTSPLVTNSTHEKTLSALTSGDDFFLGRVKVVSQRKSLYVG